MSYGITSCRECGATVVFGELADHRCDPERWVDHQVACARHDIDDIDTQVARYLETARGRFEAWYAERSRLRAA
jgi:hypothetical protein